MFALAKLLPFRDYLYAAVAIAAVTWYNVHVHNLIRADEHKRDAAVATETARVEAAAQTHIDELTAAYARDRAQRDAEYEKHIQADASTHAADLQRLRQLAAQGSGGPALAGSTSTSTPPDTGQPSLIGLGYVSEELAAALHDARNDLGACYAERDQLTGKP